MSANPNRLLATAAVLSISTLLAFACSSSTSTTSAAQAYADVAQARCNKIQQCDPQGLLNTYGDLAGCTTTQAASCVSNLSAPDTANTPEHTEGCAQAIPGESCDDYLLGNSPSACQPPAGPREAGSACAVSGQCANANCLILKTQACGTCAPAPVAGDSCANATCAPGLVCDKVTLTCAAPLSASSGACDDSSACAPGLTCLGNTDGGPSGSCVPLATLGGNCDLADGGSRCDGRFGLYCSVPAGKVCAPVANATAAQPCGTIDGGVIECVAGGFCQKPANSKSGTCVPPAADGAACDTVNGPICAAPARCVLSAVGGTTGSCQATLPQSCN